MAGAKLDAVRVKRRARPGAGRSGLRPGFVDAPPDERQAPQGRLTVRLRLGPRLLEPETARPQGRQTQVGVDPEHQRFPPRHAVLQPNAGTGPGDGTGRGRGPSQRRQAANRDRPFFQRVGETDGQPSRAGARRGGGDFPFLQAGRGHFIRPQHRVALENQLAGALMQRLDREGEGGVESGGGEGLRGLLCDPEQRSLGGRADAEGQLRALAAGDRPAVDVRRPGRTRPRKAAAVHGGGAVGGQVQFQHGRGAGREAQVELQPFRPGLGAGRPGGRRRVVAGRFDQERGVMSVEIGDERVAVLEARLAQRQVERRQRQQSRRGRRLDYLPLTGADKGVVRQFGVVVGLDQARRVLPRRLRLRRLTNQLFKLAERHLDQYARLDAVQFPRQPIRRQPDALHGDRIGKLGRGVAADGRQQRKAGAERRRQQKRHESPAAARSPLSVSRDARRSAQTKRSAARRG